MPFIHMGIHWQYSNNRINVRMSCHHGIAWLSAPGSKVEETSLFFGPLTTSSKAITNWCLNKISERLHGKDIRKAQEEKKI